MKKLFVALAASVCVLALAATPATAKKAKPAQPAAEQQDGGEEGKESGAIPRYQPFPHNQNFVLKEINGKAPPVEMWISIDSTGRANGFSGCKNWSGVFAIGPERLGPRAMPAINDHKCEGAPATAEKEYWQILMSGPNWDTQGDTLILKGFKNSGTMRFERSL